MKKITQKEQRNRYLIMVGGAITDPAATTEPDIEIDVCVPLIQELGNPIQNFVVFYLPLESLRNFVPSKSNHF
jgi:hypothetical protein